MAPLFTFSGLEGGLRLVDLGVRIVLALSEA